MIRSTLPVVFAALAVACNVPSPAKPRGASIPDAGVRGDGSADGGAPVCGRGVVVAESNFDHSTNVGLIATDGHVIGASIASSATDSVGLTAPLSADVVVPSTPITGNEIVLVDREPGASRIVWVDPRPATPKTRELSVGAGFAAYPYDYVALSRTKAYVVRWGTNPGPGKEPFDTGGDLLVVDPSVPEITASIDLAPALGADGARVYPRPNAIARSGARAFALLGALPKGSDLKAVVPSRIVTVDTATDTVTDVLVLPELFNCTALALAPSGSALAVSCSGKIGTDGQGDLAESGIVIVDITGTPHLGASFPGADLGSQPLGFSLAYANDFTLVYTTFGLLADPPVPDLLRRLDLKTSTTETVLEGDPFAIGGVACDPACSVCFVADAGKNGGVVHRFDVSEDGALGADTAIKMETDPGLPPRYLGRF